MLTVDFGPKGFTSKGAISKGIRVGRGEREKFIDGKIITLLMLPNFFFSDVKKWKFIFFFNKN